MSLEIIKVDNGSKDYHGNFAKLERELILEYCKGKVLNLFSGISLIGNIRVDYACKEANVNMDVFDFLLNYSIDCYDKFNTVIIDAPYNQKFANIYQKVNDTPKQFIIFANTRDTTKLFELIQNKIDPDRIILKSWNYYLLAGYFLKKGFLCYAGGFRKSTILEIMDKYPKKKMR